MSLKRDIMFLNGIDISNWQAYIDLTAVPADFVIAKATQGTGYVSPDCARQVEQARQSGKRFGVYHYVSGGNAIAEANFFVDNCANWVGKGLFCIDWESQENSAWGNEGYLEQVVAQVKARTGIPPLIYSSASYYAQVAAVANRQNCGLWIAQYANMNPTGYQDTPWNEGAYACVIRQYSSTGRLPGYGGNLDLNKFYGDGATFDKYVTGGGSVSNVAPSQPADPLAGRSDDDLANAVIRGEFGDGDARKQKLGGRYAAVQALVNQKLAKPESSGRTYTVQPGDTLSSIAVKLGVAQSQISGFHSGNPNLIYPGEVLSVSGGSPQPSAEYYTVQSGDNLSAIAARYSTSWQHIRDLNGLANPDFIYPGQVLRIR